MRRKHLAEFQPICLVCSDPNSSSSPIQLDVVLKEEGEHVLEGILRCSNPDCQFEYPIIDGIPILVPSAREFISASANWLLYREDLDPVTYSLIRDCEGPDGSLNQIHQLLGCYGWCHYGDLDPQLNDPDAGSTSRLWKELSDMSSPTDEPQADFGCSMGRTTFEMASQSSALTLGLDLNLGFLRSAGRILRTGEVNYPLRRSGIVYDHHSFSISLDGADKVDFWACDLHQLPFANEAFGSIHCLNTIDSVTSPVGLLQSVARSLKAGGSALIASPYDWTANVTPIEGWLGGHSQRADHRGQSDAILKQIIAMGDNELQTLEIVEERDDVPWIMRVHDRNRTHYRIHAANLKKT